MRLVTAAEMKMLDQAATEEYGVPGLVLMENAGLRVVEVIREILGEVRGKIITVFVGKGNNGGDGFVIARHLLNLGAEVKVLAVNDLADSTGDAAVNQDIWQRMEQKIYALEHGDGINIVRLVIMNTDLIVDAIFGTGFRGKMPEKVGRLVEALNSSGKPIVAVDIPSGLEADTGKALGPCVRATHTVTFALPKLGLVMEPGVGYAGELHIADISLPALLIERKAPPRYLLTAAMVKAWLPPRPSAAHKGQFGRVLIVAGSRGMTGAASLAGAAAVRTGAGLVTVAVPESLHGIMEVKLTEAMTVPLPDTGQGCLSRDAVQHILALLEQRDVLALGPGLSTQPEVTAVVREVLPAVRKPVVLDADALNALAGSAELLRKVQAPVVLTPHPGEMAKLLGRATKEIQADRLAITAKTAAVWNVVALLKGAGTVVAAPDGAVYLNPTGNPGMATGGSGDVLTGMVAALLAQKLNPAPAAAAAAYLHGQAGDLAALEQGLLGLTAGDLLEKIPQALKQVCS